MEGERYFTQSEAATFCRCDYSTIKRHRQRGHFPGIRRRTDASRTYEIPLCDLIACGLWDPARADEDGPSAEALVQELQATRFEVELLRCRLQGMDAMLATRVDEIEHLRRSLAELHRALGSGRAA